MTGQEFIKALNLAPHPEGGWFRRTWTAPARAGERASASAIYFLLLEDEESKLHRIDATELWHFYAGAPLELMVDGTRHLLGPNIAKGEAPQVVVAPHSWQQARSLGPFTLVGATVSPEFRYDGWELAES